MDRCFGRFIPALFRLSALCAAAVITGGDGGRAGEPAQVAGGSARAETTSRSLDSGPAVGEYVPSFYSRAVTGPLMNKSVCYVCRSGSRPVVAVFVRSVEPRLASLLKNIDRVVDRNRVVGLRSFGVMLSDDPFSDVGAVQTFSFDNKIAMPLTVASDSVATPSCQNIHADAAVTVVLYRQRRVEKRHAFRAGEMTADEVRTVIEDVKRFAGVLPEGEESEAGGE